MPWLLLAKELIDVIDLLVAHSHTQPDGSITSTGKQLLDKKEKIAEIVVTNTANLEANSDSEQK